MYLYGYTFPYSFLRELSTLATVEVNSFHSTSILESRYTNYFNMKAFFLPFFLSGKKKESILKEIVLSFSTF